MDQTSPTRHFVLHHMTEGTPSCANRESRSTTDLFGEPVWHLRKIVRLKAEVICHCASLGRRITNKLNVGGAPQLTARANLIADCREEVNDQWRWHLIKFAVLTARCNQR
mgnify:CR=1 FL=1